jgi:hypothetical protein
MVSWVPPGITSRNKRHFAFTESHPQNVIHGNLTSTTETYAPLSQQTIPMPGTYPPWFRSKCMRMN